MTLKEQAREMIPGILKMSMPDGAMTEALRRVKFGTGRVVLIAVGKSAWQMASVAHAARLRPAGHFALRNSSTMSSAANGASQLHWRSSASASSIQPAANPAAPSASRGRA